MSKISKMRRSLVVGNLFPCRSDLPVAMFIGHALAKRCVPHPVNPENPASEQLIAIRLQTTCLGLRREVAFAFRRCSASRKRGNVPKPAAAIVEHSMKTRIDLYQG